MNPDWAQLHESEASLRGHPVIISPTDESSILGKTAGWTFFFSESCRSHFAYYQSYFSQEGLFLCCRKCIPMLYKTIQIFL